MALARSRRERGIDYWPGFVDALSTLILGIVFLLSVFVIVQFFLSQEVTGKDTALQRLNAQLAQLTEMLSLEKVGKANLEDTLASLRANLATAESDRDRLKGLYEGLQSGSGRANELTGQLENQKSLTSRAMAQVELLNQQIAALRRQLAALEAARVSPISVSASIWRWRNVCRSCPASARNFSAACARSWVIARISAWWVTASCFSRRFFSIPDRPSFSRAGARSSTSLRPH
jgi:multidrug efflux pump subunit AcrA (membrane-fusion protein)